MAPIHDAIRAFDVEALRRELAAGVSPELDAHADDPDEEGICTPLHLAIYWGCGLNDKKLEERVACVAALLEAGAAVNAMNYSGTALRAAVQYEEFGDIVDLLIAAGADVSAVDDLFEESVIVTAAQYNDNAAILKKLISAGARDLETR
jgi:ankyrin repeat protein